MAMCVFPIRYLLEHGLDVDQEDLSGWTPLMWAAAGNNMDAIKLFEKVNADRAPKQVVIFGFIIMGMFFCAAPEEDGGARRGRRIRSSSIRS